MTREERAKIVLECLQVQKNPWLCSWNKAHIGRKAVSDALRDLQDQGLIEDSDDGWKVKSPEVPG
jgi:hypothetical protein